MSLFQFASNQFQLASVGVHTVEWTTLNANTHSNTPTVLSITASFELHSERVGRLQKLAALALKLHQRKWLKARMSDAIPELALIEAFAADQQETAHSQLRPWISF
jgi:hypothetical protein